MSDNTDIRIFFDDFKGFPIGSFPYDHEHSAMGEYHYYPAKGYTGQWYDPIASFKYLGPSWIVTEDSGTKYMEQMRVSQVEKNGHCPTLVAGEKDWTDYFVSAEMKTYSTADSCGILLRYQTSMMHYAFYLAKDSVQLYKIAKTERTLLAEKEFVHDCDNFYRLEAHCEGDKITCYVNGNFVLESVDSTYMKGCIALAAYMPSAYTNVIATMKPDAYAAMTGERDKEEVRLAAERIKYPKPVLWKVVDLKNFGAGRQLRFGHLTGTEEMFFVICQHQKRVFKDRYSNISCMTAVSVETGNVLWQIGEPSENEEVLYLTADLPFQIYDIDGDGIDEVIMARNFKLMILDGRTGAVKNSIDTPYNDDPANELCGIEFKKHAFDRLNVDAIRIVNVTGKERPSDIMIKDRYSRLWVYDSGLNLIWKFTHGNTGHFPYSHDLDGDGKDEIFSCYNMVGSDGKLVWKLPVNEDHTDEIIVGKFNGVDEHIAIVSGWEGFMLADKSGNILLKDINGHGQRISTGNYCAERSGLEICTTTYWGNQGIIYLYDYDGNELWHYEPSSNGNIIAPVNWRGDGTELILLNGNVRFGGMLDGNCLKVVEFPDDGHPDLCAEVINLTGDCRDEIVLWDHKKMYVYTQDREARVSEKEYKPEKYPHYNASNYRGEYSYARQTTDENKK